MVFILPPGIQAIRDALYQSDLQDDAEVVSALEDLENASSLEAANEAIKRMSRYSSNSPTPQVANAPATKQLMNRIADVYVSLNDIQEGTVELLDCPEVIQVGDGFDVLAGMMREKELLEMGYVLPLTFTLLFKNNPRGILLYGPPGTGKTSLARAAVGQFREHVFFFNVTPAKIKDMYVGQSDKNIEKIFKCAYAKLKEDPNYRVVIFFDEFEALAASRMDDMLGDSRTVAMLLQMMQGIEGDNDRLSCMAATNYINKLDQAVLRRFSTQIFVDLPDHSARLQILYQELSKNYSTPGVSVKRTRMILPPPKGSMQFQVTTLCGEKEISGPPEFLYYFALFGDDIVVRNKRLAVRDRIAFWKNELARFSVVLGPKDGSKLVSKRDDERGGRTPVGYSASDIVSLLHRAINNDAIRWVCNRNLASTTFVMVRFRSCVGPVDEEDRTRDDDDVEEEREDLDVIMTKQERREMKRRRREERRRRRRVQDEERDIERYGPWSQEYFVGCRRPIEAIRRDIEELHSDEELWNKRVQVVGDTSYTCETLPPDYPSKVISFGLSVDDLDNALENVPPTMKSLADYQQYTLHGETKE